MTNITEFSIWENGIYQLETEDPALGGAPAIVDGEPVAGHANAQAKQLANRTTYLKTTHETFVSDLADNTDSAKGAELIGYQGGTVADKLGEIVAGAVTPPFVDAAIDVHNHSGVAHPELSAFITSEADRAEAAADAAEVSGNIYADTTTGLAATTNGQYFSVPSVDTEEYVILYKNNSGSALEIKRYPSVEFVESVRDDLEGRLTPSDEFEVPEALWRFIDTQNRIITSIGLDGTLLAKLGIDVGSAANGLSLVRDTTSGRYTLSLGSEEGTLPIGSCTIGDSSGEYEDVLFQLLDANGRLMLRVGLDGTFFVPKIEFPETIPPSAEVVEARGTTASLSDRLVSIRPDGLQSSPLYGAEHLRETRRLLSALRSGAANTVLSVCALGDSWTDNRTHWIERVRAQMLTEYGNAGIGFVAPGRGAASADATITYSGFVATNYTSPSPHLLELESSTAGHKITVSAPQAGSVHLYYRGTAGSVRARYNAGAWSTNIAMSGVGTQIVQLPTPPVGSVTLEVEVVTGPVIIYGVEMRDDDSGIRWHKLGVGGSRASQWVAVDGAQWQAGIAGMAPHLVTLMLGTNDRYWYDSAAFGGYIQTMIDRVRGAAPLADILLISPPENVDAAAPRNLVDYAYITRQLASANKCAHLDTQMYFGDPTDPLSSYGDNGTGYILLADPVHPSTVGNYALTEAIYRSLLWS